MEAAIRLLKAGGGKVFLHELRCQCLRLVAKRGIADDIMPIDYELAEGKGMAGKVFSSRTPNDHQRLCHLGRKIRTACRRLFSDG